MSALFPPLPVTRSLRASLKRGLARAAFTGAARASADVAGAVAAMRAMPLNTKGQDWFIGRRARVASVVRVVYRVRPSLALLEIRSPTRNAAGHGVVQAVPYQARSGSVGWQPDHGTAAVFRCCRRGTGGRDARAVSEAARVGRVDVSVIKWGSGFPKE